MGGLNAKTLDLIQACFQHYPELMWVKLYGSRAKGNYKKGSDIDLAFSSSVDYSAKLLGELDNLPLPYLFDVTHYESLNNQALREHIDRVGVVLFNQQKTSMEP